MTSAPRLGPVWLLLALTAGACARSVGPVPPLPPPAPAEEGVEALLARAEALYAKRDPERVREAAGVWQRAVSAEPLSLEALAGLARARVWLSDHESDADARREAARKAVEAAQWCEQAHPRHPVCAYWMGAGLGVQARERQSTALDALPRIMQAFQKAQAGDPDQDEAGPDRALALFFVRAPAWPAGPGDPELGLEHARAAVERAPSHPPNLMALGEAQAATKDKAASEQTYRRALDLAKASAAAGNPDAAEWIEEIEGALAGRRRAR